MRVHFVLKIPIPTGKYCNGFLLMSPVFVLVVPCADFEKLNTGATVFDVRPVFRIAKCFSTSIIFDLF